MNTGERALRLFWDVLSSATGRLREVAGQPTPPAMEQPLASDSQAETESARLSAVASHRESRSASASQAEPRPRAASAAQTKPEVKAEPEAQARPQAQAKSKAPGKTKAQSKTRSAKSKGKVRKVSGKAGKGIDERQDQMARILGLLSDAGESWLSAKEISDATAKSGTAILPGNVRKVIRGRGGDLIETRSREGSRRGALEYRLTEAGRQTSSG